MGEILFPLKTKHFADPELQMKQVLANMISRVDWPDQALSRALEFLYDDHERIYPGYRRHLRNGKTPKIILITATSAFAYAFAIREAWRVAFTEPVPKFFTIDVSEKRFGPDFSPNNFPQLDDTDDNLNKVEEEDIKRLPPLL